MPVSRKPRSVEEFIGSAGTPPEKPVESKKIASAKVVTLRVPEDVLASVDVAVKQRRSGISRHAWIMEAIVEKLESLEGNSS